VQGLESFSIVLVGTNFTVQRIELDDFDFGGSVPAVQFRLPQILQLTAGEYTLQIIPNRFQLVANVSQTTQKRIDTLKNIASAFVEEYVTKRGLEAVGHNFSGNVLPAIGTASQFMQYIAWRDEFAAAVNPASSTEVPTLSLTTIVDISEQANRTLRLEPLLRDNSRLFYDLNFNWGKVSEPFRGSLDEVLSQFGESAKTGSELIDKIANMGATPRETRS
jgi:hypothetical protein